MSSSATRRRTWAGAVLGGLTVAIVGAPILIGGTQLALMHGSHYYLVAGFGLVITGLFLALRRPVAGWIYAAVLALTLVWGLWEAGFVFWSLLPRLVAPGLLGGLVCLTMVAAPRSVGRGRAIQAAGLLSIACLLVTLAAIPATYSQGQAKAGTVAVQSSPRPSSTTPAEWRYYGRDPGGARFAPFTQITPANVTQLKVAWTAHTGEPFNAGSEDQNTPVQVGDALYACTPTDVVVAFEADTGKVLWRHDPHVKPLFWNRCRGVGVYETAAAQTAAPGAPVGLCDRRILNTTIDGRLFALDAATGTPCPGFGANGVVDLNALMGPILPGFYQPTSMPTVAGDKIIVGGWVTDNVMLGEPSGVVRAFDAMTGKLSWAWDIGNPAASGAPPEGYTYTRGTPNVWSTPAFDPALGLVYLPTGNATPDYWASHRSMKTEAASSAVVAVEIATGKERWRYQTVHHDLWDYDVPAQPMLMDFPTQGANGEGGKTTPALVQFTKRGQVFVLDRTTGKPLTAVEERPAPGGAQPGEWTAPTQPYSTGMPSIGAEPLTEAMMWGISPLDQLACRIAFKKLRYEGEFTPPGSLKRPSIQYPGNGGGQNWGSGAYDPQRGLLIVQGIRTPQSVSLIPFTGKPMGKPRPGLPVIIPGSGPMAPLAERPPQSQAAVRYVSRNAPLLGPAYAPCIAPPHGIITAIDVKTRKIAWQVPAGGAEAQGPFGLASGLPIPIGTPTLGGPVATATGLTFHASTTDPYLRAYDTATGKILWAAKLPVGVGGTPMSFMSPKAGKQYVVVSAGGARLTAGGKKGDLVMAFALP